MKYIYYISLLIMANISAYHNKFADAQNSNGVSQDVKADMNDLKKMRGGSFRMWVAVSQINGVNKQRVYFWNPNRSRTDTTGLANGFIVIPDATINGITNTGNGLWDSVNFDYRINNIAGLQAALDAKGNLSYVNSLNTRTIADSTRLLNEISRAQAAEASKLDVTTASATYQPKGVYLTSYTETDPLYTANGVTKTRTVSPGYGITGGGDLSANRTFAADTASSTGLVSKTRLAANLAGYVKGVTLGGGSATFTTVSLLAGGVTTVTVPLNVTYSDINYQTTQPLVLGSGGLSLLGSLTVNSVVKNTNSVTVQLKNNALLTVALTGTVEVISLKVQ